jgi:hypothetical protein
MATTEMMITRAKYRRVLLQARTWRRTALEAERQHRATIDEAHRLINALRARAEAAEAALAPRK